MKKFDVKSLVVGIMIGTMGITTAFASSGVKSATQSTIQVTLNGVSLPLGKPVLSVTMDDEQTSSLYVPANELFTNLGYDVNYDSEKNTIDLIPRSNISDGNAVLNLANHTGQKNIAESGSFQAGDNQTLVLNITSDIKGGTVDLFLFDPSGKEQRITIGSANMTTEVPLEKGTWQYNCSGVFQDGGDIKVVGTLK